MSGFTRQRLCAILLLLGAMVPFTAQSSTIKVWQNPSGILSLQQNAELATLHIQVNSGANNSLTKVLLTEATSEVAHLLPYNIGATRESDFGQAFKVYSGAIYLPIPGLAVIRTPELFKNILSRNLRIHVERHYTPQSHTEWIYQFIIDSSTNQVLYVLRHTLNSSGGRLYFTLQTWNPMADDAPVHNGPHEAYNAISLNPRVLFRLIREQENDLTRNQFSLIHRFRPFNGVFLCPPQNVLFTDTMSYNLLDGFSAGPRSNGYLFKEDTIASLGPNAFLDVAVKFNSTPFSLPVPKNNLEQGLPAGYVGSDLTRGAQPQPLRLTGPASSVQQTASSRAAAVANTVTMMEPAMALVEIPSWPNHFVVAFTNGFVAVVQEDPSTPEPSELRIDGSYKVVHVLTRARQLVAQPTKLDLASISGLTGFEFEPPIDDIYQLPEIKKGTNDLISWTDRVGNEFLFDPTTGKPVQNMVAARTNACRTFPTK